MKCQILAMALLLVLNLSASKEFVYECKLTGEFLHQQTTGEHKLEFEVHKKKSRKYPKKLKFINDITVRNYNSCNALRSNVDKKQLIKSFKTPEHEQFKLLNYLKQAESVQCKAGKNKKIWALKEKIKGESAYIFCAEGAGCRVNYRMTCEKTY